MTIISLDPARDEGVVSTRHIPSADVHSLELIAIADRLGVRIETVTDIHPDIDGEYIHERRLIRLRAGMAARRLRTVLAHEVGHALYGDTPAATPELHARMEERAERWAARAFIDDDAFAEAYARHAGHAWPIALELGVMQTLVIEFGKMANLPLSIREWTRPVGSGDRG